MHGRHARALIAVGATLALVTTAAPAGAAVEPGPVELVSRDSSGGPGDGESLDPYLSADGRFVVFMSRASDLVAGDANGETDVFIKDRIDGSVALVSVDDQGRQLPGYSYPTSVSADGRRVLFYTSAIVPHPDGDRSVTRPMLWDRLEGTAQPLAAADRDGRPASIREAVISGNGRYLAFSTLDRLVRGDRDRSVDVHRLGLTNGAVRRVSTPPLGDTSSGVGGAVPSISHSGRVISFQTKARLVKRDRLHKHRDVYVRDLRQRRPRLVSRSSAGRQANFDSRESSVSAGGRYVVFSSSATNLVRRDTNRVSDVFLHDRRTGKTKRMSVNSRELQGNRPSQGSYYGSAPAVSRDGRFVVFASRATNLAPGITSDVGNVFVRDRRAGRTVALSVPSGGTSAVSGVGRMSADGSTVAFWSEAPDLVVDDANGAIADVFVRRLRD